MVRRSSRNSENSNRRFVAWLARPARISPPGLTRAGVFVLCASIAATAPWAFVSCGSSAPEEAPPARTSLWPRLDAALHPDASCMVTIDTPPLLPATHVPIGTDIMWDSNPPSSGPHFPIWAAYQAYTSPVPRGYYVHDLEHGAIVLLYNCPSGCPDVVSALQAVSDAIPDDPLCAAAGEGVRVRTVITPDPLLDVPVAAAAWGWTYKAQCADVPTLTSFALANYGNGPEVICGNGTTQF